MNDSPHPVAQEELMAHLDGELTAERGVVVSEHIERCGECRVSIAESRGLSERLSAWQIEPAPQSYADRMTDAINAEGLKPEAVKKPQPGRAFGLPQWVWATAGVGSLVLLLITFSIPNLLRSRIAANQAARPMMSEQQFGATQALPTMAGVAAPTAANDSQLTRNEARQFTRLDMYAKIFRPPYAGTAAGPPVMAPMIARTASLKLLTKDFDRTREALEAAIQRHHGYSAQLNVGSESGNVHSLAASFRVPADQLDATIAEIKQLAHVEQESQGGEEVTDQYVDLTARLSNARRTEQTLLDILEKRTGRLSDVLAVEQELSNVREQIERMEAERKNLQNRVSFATLQVELREEYKAELDMTTPSVGGRLRNALVEGYRAAVDSLVGTILFILNIGPFLLLWVAILFFPVRFAWRRLRRVVNAK